ncbi:MAG: PAS domain-containing sensor histidine kinase, partial [Sphingomonadaceae bacterium]
RPQRLIALMPMEHELKAEAMQAWQQLVHVLTHEIMNSLTPVASLSHSAREMLAEVRERLPPELATDLDIALDAIGRRADSLTEFVSGYRALASVPEARLQRVDIGALLARLSALIGPAWQARGGSAVFDVEPAVLELMADAGQLEQALVNLLQNAAEACAAQAVPQVVVSARLVRGGRLRIDVSDNGPGVPEPVVADIFTPFFTTKCQGSGIGLALVRQLVHRNGGAVRYARAVGGGARFVLTF